MGIQCRVALAQFVHLHALDAKIVRGYDGQPYDALKASPDVVHGEFVGSAGGHTSADTTSQQARPSSRL